MLAEGLIALAQFAGQTVAAAAITDVWESARHQFARLLGHGDPKKTQVAERWLAETHERLVAAAGADLGPVRAAQVQRWEGRLADLLDEDPGVEADLRALVEEIQATLPASVISAADHSVAALRDVNVSADRGSVAAAVVHGDVTRRFEEAITAHQEAAAIALLVRAPLIPRISLAELGATDPQEDQGCPGARVRR